MSRPPEVLTAKIERLRNQIADLDWRKKELEDNLAKALKRLELMDAKDMSALEPAIR